MEHFYEDVPKLGNVAISRHAQARIEEDDIPHKVFEDVLWDGKDTPEGHRVLLRDGKGIRIVVLLDTDDSRGAKLVKTVFRMKPVKVAK